MKFPCFASTLCFLAVSALAAAPDTHVKGTEPARIAHGERVELSDYLVPGKTTIFDFTSRYCPPCQAIAPLVEKLHHDRPDVAVVSVDINRPKVPRIDWQSPVAAQYELRSIPYFRVYGPDGQLVAQGEAARALVVKMFN